MNIYVICIFINLTMGDPYFEHSWIISLFVTQKILNSKYENNKS